MKILVLVAMLLFHSIADYKLQGILASMKQKSWWKQNAPDKLYQHDYIIALIEHAFEWTCFIYIPVLVYSNIANVHVSAWIYVISFLYNWIMHAVIDQMKANAHKINLVQDQMMHLFQIVITWIVCVLIAR